MDSNSVNECVKSCNLLNKQIPSSCENYRFQIAKLVCYIKQVFAYLAVGACKLDCMNSPEITELSNLSNGISQLTCKSKCLQECLSNPADKTCGPNCIANCK
jgi:hypothetical protein